MRKLEYAAERRMHATVSGPAIPKTTAGATSLPQWRVRTGVWNLKNSERSNRLGFCTMCTCREAIQPVMQIVSVPESGTRMPRCSGGASTACEHTCWDISDASACKRVDTSAVSAGLADRIATEGSFHLCVHTLSHGPLAGASESGGGHAHRHPCSGEGRSQGQGGVSSSPCGASWGAWPHSITRRYQLHRNGRLT